MRILMGFLCGSYAIPCYFYDLSMGLLWKLLWDFFVVPMLFPCYFYDLSMGFLWDSYGISMIFL